MRRSNIGIALITSINAITRNKKHNSYNFNVPCVEPHARWCVGATFGYPISSTVPIFCEELKRQDTHTL